ncbi:MAG: exosortase system-associated protein, TIGR04073 family, partial [Candidatus Omnitrophica bacterium]|nr:exosortase system-associated protein, TIGR04073 family [Candidatus Omnitrophota bacterium]
VLSAPLWAGDSYWGRSGQKLGRGVTNIVFSPVEIPKAIEDGIQKDETYKILLVNPVRGIFSMFGRILVGAYEVVTFWIPQKPILKPAYIAPTIREYLKEKNVDKNDGPGG